MRNTILTIAPLLVSAALSAQGVFSNKTQLILEKVIQDYPNHFNNIRGELIGQLRKTAEYRSTVQLPGSSSCTVTFYSASHEGYSWTCKVSGSQDFGQAKAQFGDIFTQLHNSIIRSNGQKTFILSGQYEEPDPGKPMTKILFSLLPGVGEMKQLKVELALRQEGNTWVIALSVTDQDAREEQEGALTAK